MTHPSTGTEERVVDRYGTGHVRTEILSRPDGRYTWIRSPGEARNQPFGGTPAPILGALAAFTTDRHSAVHCVLPRPQGPELHYTLPGYRSAAELLLSGEPSAGRAAEDLLYGLGVFLGALHATSPPAGAEAYTPLTSQRLASWIDTPQGSRATRLHDALRASLGPARWRSIQKWLDELRDAENRVLVHGGPSLGLLVQAAGADADALLIGEDAGLGPWQSDVGWVLGELSELRTWSARHRASSGASLWDRAETAFSHGYGRQPDLLAHRAAVLRGLLHLHDFCVFVTWDQAEVQQYTALLKGRIDEQT